MYVDEESEPLFRSVRVPTVGDDGEPGKTFRQESWDCAGWRPA